MDDRTEPIVVPNVTLSLKTKHYLKWNENKLKQIEIKISKLK